MNQKSLPGLALLVSCAITAWSCTGASPASPSAVGSSGSSAVRLFDEAPAPAPPAAPDPAAPDPATPAPAPTTISIVGTDGPIAFAPNPTLAVAVGATIVFTNNDTRFHHIVLDDGREVGAVTPGGSTAPITVTTTAPMPFHCTVHPSMVGAINGEIPTAPPPPAPGPYEPPPPAYDDPYGGY